MLVEKTPLLDPLVDKIPLCEMLVDKLPLCDTQIDKILLWDVWEMLFTFQRVVWQQKQYCKAAGYKLHNWSSRKCGWLSKSMSWFSANLLQERLREEDHTQNPVNLTRSRNLDTRLTSRSPAEDDKSREFSSSQYNQRYPIILGRHINVFFF